MNPRVVIIADDLSGGMNIGVEFSTAGMTTLLIQDAGSLDDVADVLIVDTETRNEPSNVAYNQTRIVAQAMGQYSPQVIVKKIDSLLRGSIGREVEAVFDATDVEKCLLIAASPKLARTTVGGNQYVGADLLETVRQKVDPSSVVEGSHIPAILRTQTALPVELIDLDTVRAGGGALQQAIRSAQASLLVADCTEQDDLNRTVEAAYAVGVRFFAGTYGTGEAVARLFAAPPTPILFVVGSLSSAAQRQVTALKEALLCQHIPVSYDESFFDMRPEAYAAPYRAELVRAIGRGTHVILQLSAPPDQIERLWQWAAARDLDRSDVSERIDRLLRATIEAPLPTLGGFMATGGSTAQALYSLFDARGLRLEPRELLPGTPGARVVGGPLDGRPFVAKPGSQGADDALVRIARYLIEASKAT